MPMDIHVGDVLELKKQHPYLEHCHIISDSDAHYLEHINEPHYTLSVKSRNPKDILNALTQPVGTTL